MRPLDTSADPAVWMMTEGGEVLLYTTSENVTRFLFHDVQIRTVETEFHASAIQLPKQCAISIYIIFCGLTHQQNVQSILLFD